MSVVHQVYGHFMRQLTSWVRGPAQKVGEQAKLLGAKKVMIVTDAFLNQIGIAKKIAGIIEETGIKTVVLHTNSIQRRGNPFFK
ncbi:hypothetical protein SDC9_33824 [bioreactor metagenome]|uniref:Alcohol dehydrogenase iron-type/glycerol dehydrogenase GldA domain-containing protein n=1 Tax=bioreactor metagenome TaxID=1076179 RepID=A0A644V8Y2_9ZZZZ